MSEEIPPVSILTDENPLAADAPIHHLLSIRKNPMLRKMSDSELRLLVQRMRTYANSAPTLSAKLQSDSNNVPTRKRKLSPEAAKRKAMLDEL